MVCLPLLVTLLDLIVDTVTLRRIWVLQVSIRYPDFARVTSVLIAMVWVIFALTMYLVTIKYRLQCYRLWLPFMEGFLYVI